MSERKLNWVILGDQHLGARNDNKVLLKKFRKFYLEQFIPYLKENNVKTLITLGDFFDRRKFINFETLKESREMFFDPLRDAGIEVHMIIGNHDTYYKNTNKVNSVELLVNEGQYSNVRVYASPETVTIDGVRVLMLPWICAENYSESIEAIRNSDGRFVVAHLEMSGFEYHRGVISDHGHCDADLLARYEYVFTGHYHHKSSRGNIHYLGTPYEMNWNDWNDQKGFHHFDGSRLTFVPNPETSFIRLTYDDRNHKAIEEAIKTMPSYTDSWIKIVVKHKKHPITFERFVDAIAQTSPVDINIIDETNAVLAKVDDGGIEELPKDTLDVIRNFVYNELQTDLDKARIVEKIHKIYTLAKEVSEDE